MAYDNPEIDLIAIIESEFKSLDHAGRVRVIRWAASWADERTPSDVEHDPVLAYAVRAQNGVQPLVEIAVALDGLTAKEHIGLLAATAVLLGVEAGVCERLTSQVAPRSAIVAPRRWTLPVTHRRRRHCSACGLAGHTKRTCAKREAFADVALPGDQVSP